MDTGAYVSASWPIDVRHAVLPCYGTCRADTCVCMCAPTRRWLHVDTGAYVSGSFTGPGRPEGGEALGLRALWRLLRERYGSAVQE